MTSHKVSRRYIVSRHLAERLSDILLNKLTVLKGDK